MMHQSPACICCPLVFPLTPNPLAIAGDSKMDWSPKDKNFSHH